MVASSASIVGVRPTVCMAADVMGPMEASVIVWGSVRDAASSSATRLRAVLALVKVMASGGLFWSRVWRSAMESGGTTLR